MSDTLFSSSARLNALVDAYFAFLEGEYHLEEKPGKETQGIKERGKKIWDREPEPATFSGMVYFLGFNSRREFDEYEQTGSFKKEMNRARLRIEMSYEKKLHNQSSTGAIFMLKSMGCNEKLETPAAAGPAANTMEVIVHETGPKLAGSEKDVLL